MTALLKTHNPINDAVEFEDNTTNAILESITEAMQQPWHSYGQSSDTIVIQ